MDDPNAPPIQAMREAMRQAEEAAEKRRLARLAAAEAAEASEASFERVAFANDAGEEDEDADAIIERTRLGGAGASGSYTLDAPADLRDVLAALDAAIPDPPGHEVDGDLIVFRHDVLATPWYRQAAEEAMPEALRVMEEPLDVRQLLQALLVEVGDVKRTNAMMLDKLAILEEKVERTHRLMREKRVP